MKRDPYQIIKHRHVTEKAQVLEGLKNATSNVSLKRCESPKYVFIVHPKANKQEIAWAIKQIYGENIGVVAVNTINVKAKKRRMRGRLGQRSAIRKAIVTFEKNDSIDDTI